MSESPRDVPALRASVRRLGLGVYFLTIRQGARRFLDVFRFGTGVAERLTAAVVLGAGFFLVILGAAMATGTPLPYGLGVAGVALGVAWGTSAAFVLGPTDEAVGSALELRRAARTDLAAELKEAEAEQAVLAEERRAAERDRAPAPQRPRTKPCPYCAGPVAVWAAKCRHCGEFIDEGLRQDRVAERSGRRKNFYPLAAFLSFLWPGLGQIAKGQVGRGFAFMAGEVLGCFLCFIPGIVIRVINIFDAAVYNE